MPDDELMRGMVARGGQLVRELEQARSWARRWKKLAKDQRREHAEELELLDPDNMTKNRYWSGNV